MWGRGVAHTCAAARYGNANACNRDPRAHDGYSSARYGHTAARYGHARADAGACGDSEPGGAGIAGDRRGRKR